MANGAHIRLEALGGKAKLPWKSKSHQDIDNKIGGQYDNALIDLLSNKISVDLSMPGIRQSAIVRQEDGRWIVDAKLRHGKLFLENREIPNIIELRWKYPLQDFFPISAKKGLNRFAPQNFRAALLLSAKVSILNSCLLAAEAMKTKLKRPKAYAELERLRDKCALYPERLDNLDFKKISSRVDILESIEVSEGGDFRSFDAVGVYYAKNDMVMSAAYGVLHFTPKRANKPVHLHLFNET